MPCRRRSTPANWQTLRGASCRSSRSMVAQAPSRRTGRQGVANSAMATTAASSTATVHTTVSCVQYCYFVRILKHALDQLPVLVGERLGPLHIGPAIPLKSSSFFWPPAWYLILWYRYLPRPFEQSPGSDAQTIVDSPANQAHGRSEATASPADPTAISREIIPSSNRVNIRIWAHSSALSHVVARYLTAYS